MLENLKFVVEKGKKSGMNKEMKKYLRSVENLSIREVRKRKIFLLIEVPLKSLLHFVFNFQYQATHSKLVDGFEFYEWAEPGRKVKYILHLKNYQIENACKETAIKMWCKNKSIKQAVHFKWKVIKEK